MVSALESNIMVNPLDDLNDFKDAEKQILLSALKEFILNLPEMNKTKIEILKEELANERYQVLSQQIAEKMFADIELA